MSVGCTIRSGQQESRLSDTYHSRVLTRWSSGSEDTVGRRWWQHTSRNWHRILGLLGTSRLEQVKCREDGRSAVEFLGFVSISCCAEYFWNRSAVGRTVKIPKISMRMTRLQKSRRRDSVLVTATMSVFCRKYFVNGKSAIKRFHVCSIYYMYFYT
jgi:hypothetical protein